jgi:hypothetical protein
MITMSEAVPLMSLANQEPGQGNASTAIIRPGLILSRCRGVLLKSVDNPDSGVIRLPLSALYMSGMTCMGDPPLLYEHQTGKH